MLWWNLEPLDWIESLSNGLRADTRGASADQLAALEQASAGYRERFSYAFICHQPGHGVEHLVAAITERRPLLLRALERLYSSEVRA